MRRSWVILLLLSVVACSSGGGGSGAASGGSSGTAGSGGLGGASSGGTGAGGNGGIAGTGTGGAAGSGTGGVGGTGGVAGAAGTGGANAYCKAELPTTVTPGAPFDFIRPISTGYLDAVIESVRELPQQFAEAELSVDHCAVLSKSDATTDHARVAFAASGDASLTDKWDGNHVLGSQGAGVFAFNPTTGEVSLYASQDLTVAPVFSKSLNSSAPKPVPQGGFLAALWNGNSAKAFTWENISMSVQDKSGYLVRAGSNGAVQWAHQIQNGSAAILTVDDLGASVLRISRAGAASGSSPVTMDGTQLIPPGTDALGCTLAQVSPAGSINWVKRIKTCSDGNIRWALSPTSQELHVVSKANVDWGDGAATQSTLEHVLTKLDTSGNVAWHQSVVTFSSNITSYGYPWLIVADNDIPMVYGYLEKTISFGGNTLTNQAGKDGVFIEAFEKTGAPRWLNGFTDCSKVDSAWFSPLARVHGKVALGVVVSSCTVNGTSIATPINNLYAFTSNLVVITP